MDAKTTGGVIDLPENTPFILMGDLNLVGLSQQLTTLVSGDIQDTITFGPGAYPDWDDTELTDLISRQSDKRMAYTWRNDEGSYPPGRLDFMIFSNSVMDIAKAFTLQTEVMPLQRLDYYGLGEFDTRTCSDHLPKVADFILEMSMDTEDKLALTLVKVYPNPSSYHLNIESNQLISQLRLINVVGQQLILSNPGSNMTTLDVSKIQPGFYFLLIETEEGTYENRIIIQ